MREISMTDQSRKLSLFLNGHCRHMCMGENALYSDGFSVPLARNVGGLAFGQDRL